jgi:acyl transferase domain-containing protein
MYTRSGGFLQDSLWDFDAEFFGISPREASIMDPQQRLLLEVTQEAMDDAGVSGRVARQPVGVYIGATSADNMMLRQLPTTRAAATSHTATAGTFTMLSNGISFVYDLRGPSMTIDTACSSSLVALHEAVQAMARGEIELVLVGGVNALLIPEPFVVMCKARMLAEDGHCKSFHAAADGYARGEGAGVLVLKSLADASRGHDRIYAVIRPPVSTRTDARRHHRPQPRGAGRPHPPGDGRVRSSPGTDRVRRGARHRYRGRRPTGDGRPR